MNILFATGQPFIPQMLGGLQMSATTLALHLKQRGHQVAQLSGLMSKGYLGIRGRFIIKFLRHKAAKDMTLGYPVWRAWFTWESVGWVADRIKPDIIIVLARQPVKVALAAKRTGVPVLMMLQDVEFGDHGGSFEELGNIPSVANSRFTADRYHKAFGITPDVIHPLIDVENYRTESTRENVTLINPHPLKGVQIAIAIARACPEIPFSFVETWPLSDEERASLMQSLTGVQNITLLPSTRDMRQVYGKCRILLAPSTWEEAYGRVASEAQFNGIPVVASNRGGLPDAVGPGGVLLNPEGPIEHWIQTVKRLWSDSAYYAELSASALAYSARTALNRDSQVRMWEKAIAAACAPGTGIRT